MSKLSEDKIKELQEAFAEIDTNGDGMITREELTNMYAQIGLSDREDLITEFFKADSNEDGRVSFNEFLKAVSG